MASQREGLRALNGARHRFRANVDRRGSKHGYRGDIETICFTDVRNVASGELVTDHVWFTAGKWSQSLRVGHVVEFNAAPAEYQRGYYGRRDVYVPPSRDWKLARPTKVVIVNVDGPGGSLDRHSL